jgi:O-antigen/teichoic acid export membrane protein
MIADRIIKNTAHNALGRFWLILVNLFLTPLILSYLGDQRFALWALFWTFSTWFSFMDLGIGSSVIREVARLSVANDADEVNTTLFSAVAFNFTIGLILLLMVWASADWLVSMIHVGDALRGEALALAHIGPVAFLLIGLMSIFDCFLRGMQRYSLIVIASVAVSFINAFTVWLVLHYGYGIHGLVLAVTFVYLVQLGLLAWFSRLVFPAMAFRSSHIQLARIRQMLPFGLHLQVSRLAELASYQTDKIILAVLTPLYYVTTYDLGAKIALLLRDAPFLLISAIFPAISQMHAVNDYRGIWLVYERGSKYLWMTSTPLFLGLCITAPFVIELWLGHVSPHVYHALMILGLGYWGNVNSAVVSNIAIGVGWSKPIMRVSVIQAVANLVLSWMLATTVGYVGVLYGTAFTLIATGVLLYLQFCHHFDRSRRRDLWQFLRVLSANVPPAALCLGYLYFSGHWGIPASRMDAAVPLIVCIAIYGLLYPVFIRVARLLDTTDMEWLGSYCPAIVKKYLFAR